MKSVYIQYKELMSPLAASVAGHLDPLCAGSSGLNWYAAAGFNDFDCFLGKMDLPHAYRFSHLLRQTCRQLAVNTDPRLLHDDQTLVILSSTKGEMDDLGSDTFATARQIIREELKPKQAPVIISNACISGVEAVNVAADYVRFGNYKQVIVIGIDVLTDFIVFGFQSLFALSQEACKPYDKNRKGVSLGEACGTLILSAEKPQSGFYAEYLNGASSNDANHISGPSRTGEGLVRAVERTMSRCNVDPTQIDYISAHGTATIFNDEMESIAFNRLNLSQTAMNSMKGYFGHTLGASGVIEIITSLLSMEHSLIFRNIGFDEPGTSQPLNVIRELTQKPLNLILKTASGFGGGNAASILKKNEH